MPRYDVVIRNGMLYDGSGREARAGDVAIRGDRIAAVGTVPARGRTEIDAHGLAVAPGFINIMSQAQESLLIDGRAMSDLKQGVTTEIFGEGESIKQQTHRHIERQCLQQIIVQKVDEPPG